MGAYDFFALPALVSTLAKIGSGLRDHARSACFVVFSWPLVSALPRSGACLLASDADYILAMGQVVINTDFVEGVPRIR